MRIVIIDDSLDVQRSLARLLASVPGLDVVGCARDVTEALSLIESVQPDVIVLDVNLLDGDKGIDVLRYVKRQRPRMEVVVLSEFVSQRLRQSFLDAGASVLYGKSTEFMQAKDWIAKLASGMSRGDASSAPP